MASKHAQEPLWWDKWRLRGREQGMRASCCAAMRRARSPQAPRRRITGHQAHMVRRACSAGHHNTAPEVRTRVACEGLEARSPHMPAGAGRNLNRRCQSPPAPPRLRNGAPDCAAYATRQGAARQRKTLTLFVGVGGGPEDQGVKGGHPAWVPRVERSQMPWPAPAQRSSQPPCPSPRDTPPGCTTPPVDSSRRSRNRSPPCSVARSRSVRTHFPW